MDFGEALTAIKGGQRVRRAGWNGKGMFIYLVSGSLSTITLHDQIGGVPRYLFDLGDERTVTRLPCIGMRTADGAVLHGWLASQTDMLAEDWEIVE